MSSLSGTFVSVPWKHPAQRHHGAKTLITDGGGRYWAGGRSPGAREASWWEGGYHGPKAVAEPARVRDAFTGTFGGPVVYTLNLEGPHWTMVTSEVGATRARQHAQKAADLADLIRRWNPQAMVGHYPALAHRDYWTAVQYDQFMRSAPSDFARLLGWAQTLWLQSPVQRLRRWERSHDNVRFLIDHLDYVSPSLYRLYEDQPESYIRLHMQETRRVAGDKPVLPYFCPVFHDLNKAAGGQPIPLHLWERDLRLAWNHGADGVVIWAALLDLITEDHVRIAQSVFGG